MRYSLILLAAAALGVSATQASSQTVTAGFSATIPQILDIQTNANDYTFNAASTTDYTNGYMPAITWPTLTTKGNVNYKVTTQATAATLSAAPGTAWQNKPAGDVKLDDGTNRYGVALGTPATPTNLFTTTASDTKTTVVRAHMNIAYATDLPGTYSTVVTFTIASN